MEAQNSILLVDDENFGWTVVTTVNDGELEVTGKTSGETEIPTEESPANTQQAFEEVVQQIKAEQAETTAGSEIGKRGWLTAKRQVQISEKGETEGAVKVGEVGEEEEYTQEEEEEDTEKDEEETQKEEQEGEEEEEENESEDVKKEQGRAFQHRMFAIEEVFCRIFSKDEQVRDSTPKSVRKAVVQHQEHKQQAGLLCRISLMATLGILGWAVLCGGGFKLHSCNIREREPVLNSHLNK